jgi:molybdopterin-guanine dinucleotide biosynthesis protein
MSMKKHCILSVTGAHSGVGKTTLCSILLKEFKGFGAIKFTKTGLYTSVVDSPEILDEEGKDTSIMINAGAERVVWVRSPVENLNDALEIALQKLSGTRGVVIEGNSPVDFLNPHLVIFIIGEDGEIKPTALNVSRRADIIVINSEDPDLKRPSPVPASRKDSKFFRINLKEKKGEIGEFLAYVRRKLD